jgi:hypothetical protein
MSNFDTKTLDHLKELYDIITGSLEQKEDYTVQTTAAEGTSYTHDRETYLQLGLEIAQEELGAIIHDVQERVDLKKKFTTIK